MEPELSREELIRLGEKYINNYDFQKKMYGPMSAPYDPEMPVLQAIRYRNENGETRDLPVNRNARFNRFLVKQKPVVEQPSDRKLADQGYERYD